MFDCDIIVIGAGAAGLMAACASARKGASVLLLEKMPRAGRKIMITGKGRCNFTNVKKWDDFSNHIRKGSRLCRGAFYNLTPEALCKLFREEGMESVVERGDRAFPASHKASDVVDTLVSMCRRAGAQLRFDCPVRDVVRNADGSFTVTSAASSWTCRKVILATGGLSYPTTGSDGDGHIWAKAFGHKIVRLLPSLTALVPKGYKTTCPAQPGLTAPGMAGKGFKTAYPELKKHLDRSLPLSAVGEKLCGNQLKNVAVSLWNGPDLMREETGDLDFTDGGIEGPVGFTLSRDCVCLLEDGGHPAIIIDLKPGIGSEELLSRLVKLLEEIREDPRRRNLGPLPLLRILLGKLMPAELREGFLSCHPDILKYSAPQRGKGRTVASGINLQALARSLKEWRFDIEGFVGFERCVVTSGGVGTDEIVPKTMESKLVKGLYICGELLDMDADTGGYNLHLAFSSGFLAGQSAAAKEK